MFRLCLAPISAVILLSSFATPALPQSADSNSAILQRLDQLEKQNQELRQEIEQLRQQVKANAQERGTQTAMPPSSSATGVPPSVNGSQEETANEHEAVDEHRIEELAQTKVEASQRFPIKLTGELLFNAFTNGPYGGGAEYPTYASATSGARSSGATFRQTILGLTFHGPQTFLGGTVSGSLYMDFFGGTYDAPNPVLRLRLATLQLDWTNTSFAVGQDKPLVSRREPNSFAQVGVSPLTNAGNPWLWRPQARIEQRFHLTDRTTISAEAGVFETKEGAYQSEYAATGVESARPALEARVNFKHQFGADRAIEVAPVFHTSTSHVLGQSIPSRLYGADWLVKPMAKVEVTGMIFHGQNFANLGALGGFTVLAGEQVVAVHGSGGWAQIRYLATKKLSFDWYGGQQDNRNRDLISGAIAKNQYYAVNAMYLLAPNVVGAFEVGRARTNYLGLGNRLNTHYDLALAYLF
jgi:hypothetical protein